MRVGETVMFKHDVESARRAAGNSRADDVVPAVIVKLWNDLGYANLMVLNDGPMVTWETSVNLGTGQRQYTTIDPCIQAVTIPA
jgi:hypothetical protein